MNKHTPGPWRVEMEDDTPVIWAHPNEHDISVCEIGWEPIPDQARPMRDNGTAIGNARLIAAAPDMARELMFVRDCFAEICELVRHGHFDAAEDYADANSYEVAQSIRLALDKAGLGES